MRGTSPIGWIADVEYVAGRENQSHGSSLGREAAALLQRHALPVRVRVARRARGLVRTAHLAMLDVDVRGLLDHLGHDFDLPGVCCRP